MRICSGYNQPSPAHPGPPPLRVSTQSRWLGPDEPRHCSRAVRLNRVFAPNIESLQARVNRQHPSEHPQQKQSWFQQKALGNP